MSEFVTVLFDPQTKVKEWHIKEKELDYVAFPVPKKINDTDYSGTATLRRCFKTNLNYVLKIEMQFDVTIKSRTGNLVFNIDDNESIKAMSDTLQEVERRFIIHANTQIVEPIPAISRERVEKFVRSLLISRAN